MPGEDTKMAQKGQKVPEKSAAVEVVIEQNTDPERAVWGKQLEFILTMVGYAVGLGNVWRFPYLCYKNGGGAFLVPYTLCLIFLGIPVFGLEVAFGQFGGRGPISIWGLSPSFKGVGYAGVLTTVLVAIYYNVIIAWALYYLVRSFTSELPWSQNLCTDCRCIVYAIRNISLLTSGNSSDGGLNSTTALNSPALSNIGDANETKINCSGFTDKDSMSPSEVFFNDVALNKSSGIAEAGEFQVHLVIANLVGWTVVLLVLSKGIQSLGKVVYVTSTFPYVLLTILLVKAVMLDGAYDGIVFYLVPEWSRLSDANVWSDAAVQIFFSLSACQGGLIALSSYNKFDNNVLRDSLLVPIINCSTSFYAGFVVFSVLGYMAKLRGVSVAEVTQGGPGLAFVVYPEAVSQMPISPLWAVLFFLMVIMLGFSTAFSAVETIMTSFIDEFPQTFGTKKRAFIFRFLCCAFGFILGLPMVTAGGSYLLDIVDSYVVGFPTLFVGLLELIIIAWIYGAKEFTQDVKAMIHRGPYKFYVICWVFISPVMLMGVIAFKAYQYTPLTANTELYYPWWSEAVGWGCILFPLIFIPGWFCYYICKYGVWEKLKELHQPQEAWTSRRQLSTLHKDDKVQLDVSDDDVGSLPTDAPRTPSPDFDGKEMFTVGGVGGERETEEQGGGGLHAYKGASVNSGYRHLSEDGELQTYASPYHSIALPRYFRDVEGIHLRAPGAGVHGVYSYTVREDAVRPAAYDNRAYERDEGQEETRKGDVDSPRSGFGSRNGGYIY